MMRALEEGLTPGKATRAREAITAGIPLRRYGTPEEVARMTVKIQEPYEVREI